MTDVSFTEDDALDWLRSNPEGRTSMSEAELGRLWGWHRQRVGRWLKRWSSRGAVDAAAPSEIREKTREHALLVYFIRAGNCVKIGSTHDLDGRLADLQIGNYQELEVMATIENVTSGFEFLLHKKFKKYHVRGEWFELSFDLRAFIISAKLPPE